MTPQVVNLPVWIDHPWKHIIPSSVEVRGDGSVAALCFGDLHTDFLIRDCSDMQIKGMLAMMNIARVSMSPAERMSIVGRAMGLNRDGMNQV